MNIAKKILDKYGWKEGNGLGKNQDGIAKPLRPNLKFDKSGLGSDQAASDFNNHWWERVFNEAASNLDIKTKSDGICIDLKNPKETVEITTKEYSVKKLKKAKSTSSEAEVRGYDNFLQSATLSKAGDTIENPNKITADEIDVKKFKHLTDEELFKACGGRTAHKGARHGLKLSGKLNRLELQEKEFLKILAKKKQSQTVEPKKDVKETLASQNKLKKEKEKQVEGLTVEKNIEEKTKRKRKPSDDLSPYKSDDLELNSVNDADVLELPRKKKQKKTVIATTVGESAEIEGITDKPNKEKRSRKQCKKKNSK